MEWRALNEKRRSVNYFDPSVTITVSDLQKIYEAAKLAPSSFNLQPWKVVAVLSKEEKEKLRAVAMNQPKVTEASAVLVLFGNTRQFLESQDVFDDRVAKGYMKAEEVPRAVAMAERLYAGDRAVGYASRNVGLFAMNLMFAALDQGWDTHPMDGFDVEGVQKLFGLDPKYVPVMLLAIGKKRPDAALLPRGMRRSFDEVFILR
ncbi:nitroreductase family protein [Desulfosoma caldarium]|uniref:Nitroreductase n=1 Tax=Desulfosoma caldarium TaxID=610254 RepID=A0A3N1UMK9_9BACT|nr:nitroreductase family protein [Desulfosoma caldarium]ROQ90629.1 nitroreductase [Desulfosoma caldarium]